jgi:hypothetical protein
MDCRFRRYRNLILNFTNLLVLVIYLFKIGLVTTINFRHLLTLGTNS